METIIWTNSAACVRSVTLSLPRSAIALCKVESSCYRIELRFQTIHLLGIFAPPLYNPVLYVIHPGSIHTAALECIIIDKAKEAFTNLPV